MQKAKLNHSEANNKQRLSTKKIRKTKTSPHINLLQLQSNARYLAYFFFFGGGGGLYLSMAQSYAQISNENHNENSTLRKKKKATKSIRKTAKNLKNPQVHQ